MKKEIERFIVKARLVPAIDVKGQIAHKYSYQDIVELIEEKYNRTCSRSTIGRICRKSRVEEQFQHVIQGPTKQVEGALTEAEEKGVLAQHLSKLENIFALDLEIVNAIARVHHSYMQNLLDKMEEGAPITPQEINALSSIGESSSKRVMRLFDFILSNSKEEKDINVVFPDGMAFNEQKKQEEENESGH
jgi:Zn-dependent M32 family carboxypeptidase